MNQQLVPFKRNEPHLSSSTLERINDARAVVKNGDAGAVIDALIYLDALGTIAREKRAAEVALEASQARIDACRRLGQMVLDLAEDVDAQEDLWAIIPARFQRCDELAAVPERLFKKAVSEIVQDQGSCSITTVIRRARIASLKRVEPDIYVAYDGSYWIAQGKKRTHVHRGDLEEARRWLGLLAHPHASTLDEAYSRARIAANGLSRLGPSLSGEPRRLLADAELAQGRVAELLDAALKALVTP